MDKVEVAGEAVDLRRGVDHIGLTVCFLVHDGKGKILLQKRSQKCRDERGRWDIGGGAVEFGEPMIEAAKREIMEELYVEPLEIEFVSAYEAFRENAQGEPTHWVALLHIAKVDPAQIKIGEPEKIDEIGWFGKDNLPSPLHSMFDQALEVAINENIIE